MNYYAVKKGRTPGIYMTWDDCKKQVMGHSGAVYKKFTSLQEAENFIKASDENFYKKKIKSGEKAEDISDEVSECGKDEIISYVDGSYRLSDKTFSYGAVLFDGEIYETFSKRFYDEDASMRNVSGEIKGAMYAMQRAVELGKKVVYIHYDYAGIENWALGNWKANKDGTKEYKSFYNNIKDKIDVKFIKVKAHSGVEYNEVVDKLAKEAN